MGLPGIILKREFVHLFLPSVCAAACVHPFIDWNPGFELPCKWFFFECALATPSHTPPPAVPRHPVLVPPQPIHVRTRIGSSRSCASLVHACLRYSSVNLCRSFWLMVRRSCVGRQHSPSSPRVRLKRNLKPGPPLRCEMTRRRANKKEARSGILVIFAAPGACVTRVPVPEISRPPSFPSCAAVPPRRACWWYRARNFFFSNVAQLSRPDLL